MGSDQIKKPLHILTENILERTSGVDITGVSGSEKAYIVSRIYRENKMPIVVITPTQKEGEAFLGDLRFFLNDRDFPICFFPSYNIQPFKSLSYHNETAASRIRILYQLMEGSAPPIVVTTAGAFIQKLIPRQEITEFADIVMENEDIERDYLVEKLITGGYVRTMLVEEPGDFSVRGGILDVYTPLYPDPVRIEFFGDTVDSIRFFSAATQRKMKSISEAVILPSREAVLKKQQINQVINRVRIQASELELPVTKVRELVDRIKKEGVFTGIESLLSLVYPELDTFFDYLPKSTCFVLSDPMEISKAAEKIENQAERNFLAACNEKRLCVEPDTLFMKWSAAEQVFMRKNPLTLQTFAVSKGKEGRGRIPIQYNMSVEDNNAVSTQLRNPIEKERLLLPLVEWINDKRKAECTTIVVCSTDSQEQRLEFLLDPYDIKLRRIEGFPENILGKGIVYICQGHISSGFVWAGESLAVITEDEIFGVKRRTRKKTAQRVRTELIGFGDLKKDDLVVHSDHGIGKYNGLKKLKLEGVKSDFVCIAYKGDDKLYLPVDHLGLVRKYLGVDGVTPVLDKMGGTSWQKVKNRTKKEVQKIAGELLKLYATRKVQNGHAFSRADKYFRDFEGGFKYEETPDQLKVIDDVLMDMEASTPMDRLVCGDVGYGKTEVALRASFKSVSDSKQVAVLVPTTVLAEQHYSTFCERFERYPVTIACLNRFRSPKEQKTIVHDLKEGKIDIVIGTHRLIQKDVAFKDLGLIVLDEEQRFGVRHKEKLKKMRSTVDVLATTATPIPRTLHMSMMGVRDISIISTPPEERHAIITYISEFDDAVIKEAIRKELQRKGQIFFIHNNIHSIWKVARYIKDIVPEVRMGVAHGRLKEAELEQVMLQFIGREIDLLVCTSIVESGLDIPSANTILINRADRFGLAQIYQLRGRVGRSDEQAYAYLFIPADSTLSKDAQKRLKVLMEHSDLGSGFQIAMNDLQIRGGGSALGISQSGHIAAVGYDMFLQLMENTMSELKGEPVVEDLEPEINVPISAYISEQYIPDIDQRLSAYRRLARMTELKELSQLKEEMTDRYGALPDEASSLLLKIMLKVLAVKAGVKQLDLNSQGLSLQFSEIHQKHPFGIVEMINSQPAHYKFTPDHIFKAKMPKSDFNRSLAVTKKILKEIAHHVNS